MKLLKYFKQATNFSSLIIASFGLSTIAGILQINMISRLSNFISEILSFASLIISIVCIIGTLVMSSKILRELRYRERNTQNKSFLKSVAMLCYVSSMLIWIFHIILFALVFVISSPALDLTNQMSSYITIFVEIIYVVILASNIALIVGFGMCNVCKHKLIDMQNISAIDPLATSPIENVTYVTSPTNASDNVVDNNQPNAISNNQ